MKLMTRFLLLVLVLCLAREVDAATPLYVYPNGTQTFTVPASQSLNVFDGAGGGSCKVFKQVGGPANNNVARFTLETSGTVGNGESIFGPYTNATTIRIDAGPDLVSYSIGATINSATNPIPVLTPSARLAYTQFAAVLYSTTATITPTDIMSGLVQVTDTAGTTVTFTLPTGTFMDTAAGLQINQGVEWTFLNMSANPADIALLAATTGHTILGSAAIPAATAGTGGLAGNAVRFLTRKTAANTYVTIRIQ